MFTVMAPPRQIAPSTTTPLPIAPVSVTADNPSPKSPEQAVPAIAANDVIFVNGQAFNGRGYEVCGVANQRGRLCGRIGQCPFHHKKNNNATPKRPRTGISSTGQASDGRAPATASEGAASSGSGRNAAHPTVRQMAIPPQKSRFKRSWTTDEHKRFLQAMRIHGKGKWKEIAAEVKTRTANQCQSHAQKYFLRQKKSDAERKKKSIHDVTEEDVSNEMRTNAAWPPNPLQTLAQSAVQSATPLPMPATHNPATLAATLVSQPMPAAVPIAPVEENVEPSVTVDAATAVTKPRVVQASSTIPTTINLALAGEADSLVPWGASISASSAAVSSPVVSAPSTSTAGNSVSVVPASNNGVSTVPVVVPVTSLGLPYASMVSSFINPSLGGAGGAAVVAPPPPPKIRVTVHVNGKLKGGMALMLPKSLEEFFQIAQSKLRFEGVFCRVFTRSGGEITHLDEMCQDDMLWLSMGEDFMTPK